MTTKMIVITGFLVAFAAGMMVGSRHIETGKPLQVINPPTTGPMRSPRGGGRQTSMLVHELTLTPEQAQKMNDIFRKAAETGHDLDETRRNAQQKRDDGIIALARQEQNDKYEQILKDYADVREKVNEQWRTSYAAAVEQAKRILNDDQRKHYEEILNRNNWEGGRGSEGRGRGGPGGRQGPGFGGPRGGDPGRDDRPHLQLNNEPTTGRAGQ